MKSKNSKLILGLIVAILAIVSKVQAQDKKDNEPGAYKERPIQISFVPGFGTGNGPEEGYTNKFSLNVLGGYEHSLNGGEFGGIFNMNKYNVQGGQFAGALNTVGGSVRGGQFAGLANTSGGTTIGGQFAGFANISKGYMSGGQFAGFANVSGDNVHGGQFAGFTNVADSVKGAQIVGFANVAPQGVDGAQIAGFTNVSGKVKGAQIAGFLNRAQRLEGTQVGLINVTDSLEKGVAIGLINIIGNGLKEPGIEYNDVFDVNVSFRSGMPYFYSILFAGMQAKEEFLWTYGAGLGTQYKVARNVFGNVELTSQFIHEHDEDNWDLGENLNLLNKVNLNFGYQFARHLAIQGGPSLNIYVTNRQDPTSGDYGLDIGNSIFYDEMFSDTNVKMWIGYNVALKF